MEWEAIIGPVKENFIRKEKKGGNKPDLVSRDLSFRDRGLEDTVING